MKKSVAARIIPYAKQDISESDIAAVVEVLRSDWLTQGPMIERFEQALCAYAGVPHATAVCNATSALHLACRALGCGVGDWVWTSPITFVASANCALYCGALVDFVDIDPDTYNMSVADLAAKLELAEREGRLPKIVIPVHFSGESCDMKSIAELAHRYGFRIIEDASHAIGGTYDGKKIGCCEYSDIAIFSFHPAKIVTTGEGGAAVTRDSALHEALQTLRTHGIVRARERLTTPTEGAWYYEQVDLGYNYRITDIQAALGHSQLTRIDEFVARRRKIAARYDYAFREDPVKVPVLSDRSAWHLYVVQVAADRRKEIFGRLRDLGILVNVHYIPVHLQPYYAQLGFRPGMFPLAEAYYERALTLPMYASLEQNDQEHVISCLRSELGRQ